MNPFAAGIVGALPGIWAWRHRRSLAVRNWSESTLPVTATDPLFIRSAGAGDTAFVLLHGLISTGDVFGRTFDQLGHQNQIVVPDLAGFGRSLQEGRASFTVDDHLDALDSSADLKVSYRNFSESDNPPILHRKDTFIPEDHPNYPKYARLTREEAAGLLNQPDIGRRDGWQAALAEAGKQLKGHRLTNI